MNKILVKGHLEKYWLHVEAGISESELIHKLQTIKEKVYSCGSLATELLKATNAVLTRTNYYTPYYFAITYLDKLNVCRVMQMQNNKIIKTIVWDTPNYTGKLVKFTYSGGSKPNEVRFVKVEEDTESYLRGYDLEYSDLHAAYRCYLKSKISGKITILNGE